MPRWSTAQGLPSLGAEATLGLPLRGEPPQGGALSAECLRLSRRWIAAFTKSDKAVCLLDCPPGWVLGGQRDWPPMCVCRTTTLTVLARIFATYRLTAPTPSAGHSFKHTRAARVTLSTPAVRRQIPRRHVVLVAADQHGTARVTMSGLANGIVDIASVDVMNAYRAPRQYPLSAISALAERAVSALVPNAVPDPGTFDGRATARSCTTPHRLHP